MAKRTVNDVDVDLLRAALQRACHPHPVSQRGNMATIDGLLDERIGLMSLGDLIRAKGRAEVKS